MPISLYFDVHVDHAIAAQLRLRNVDVLTAQDDNADQLADELLLLRTSELGRPLFTHDIRLHAMALKWQREGRTFGGLVFAHLLQVSIGECVRDLEIVAKATDTSDWTNGVIRLPL